MCQIVSASVSGCCLWWPLLLLVVSVHGGPVEEPHLETLIDSKAQKLVEGQRRQQEAATNGTELPEMVEQLALELERAVAEGELAEQHQQELARLVDLPGLVASPAASPPNHGGDKRHRLAAGAKKGDFYRRLVDRINSQPQGLLAALDGPAPDTHIVLAHRSLATNQLVEIGNKHSALMERARNIGYFGQRRAHVGGNNKKIAVAKSIHRKLNWLRRLYLPVVYLKNMPIIGDEIQKYLAVGGPLIQVIDGVAQGLETLVQHCENNEQQTPLQAASPTGLGLSSLGVGAELPAEVAKRPNEVDAVLSEATVRALESTTSHLLSRSNIGSKLVESDLVHRLLGFIVCELARRMFRALIKG